MRLTLGRRVNGRKRDGRWRPRRREDAFSRQCDRATRGCGRMKAIVRTAKAGRSRLGDPSSRPGSANRLLERLDAASQLTSEMLAWSRDRSKHRDGGRRHRRPAVGRHRHRDAELPRRRQEVRRSVGGRRQDQEKALHGATVNRWPTQPTHSSPSQHRRASVCATSAPPRPTRAIACCPCESRARPTARAEAAGPAAL